MLIELTESDVRILDRLAWAAYFQAGGLGIRTAPIWEVAWKVSRALDAHCKATRTVEQLQTVLDGEPLEGEPLEVDP